MAEPIRQMLRKHGLRATHARLLLLDHLHRATRPVAATTIAAHLESVCDRPTVYRNLTILTDVGLIEDLGRAGGQTWFRSTLSQRAFGLLFVCSDCVRAFPLEADAPAPTSPEWRELLREAFLLATGICLECRADRGEA
jgi:Fe2+ or Zn2+ uptake regulation protein